MAATEFAHFERLRDHLEQLGADPIAAMAPFVAAFDAFHVRTASSDWLEGLVTAYVGDGLAADFYTRDRGVPRRRHPHVIVESLRDAGHSAFVVDRVRAAIAADHRVGGRLALWGRRLMGEALTQAQRVAAERDALTALLAGGVDRPGMDLAAIGRLFTRLTENHTSGWRPSASTPERPAGQERKPTWPTAGDAELDVRELVGRDDDPAALAVGEREHRGLTASAARRPSRCRRSTSGCR